MTRRAAGRRVDFGFPVPARAASLDGIVNLHDFEPVARERLDPRAYGYYASGAGDERSLRDNLASWSAWRLLPRVLTGSKAPDLAARLHGADAALPFGIAPTALQGMAHPEGELAMARAAARRGIPYVLSTASTRSIEEVAAAVPADVTGTRWFQLYVEHDLAHARELVLRAEAAGYTAIVLTVDLPVAGYRERDMRNHFEIPMTVQAHLPAGLAEDAVDFRSYIDTKPELRWADVETIAGWTSLPLVLKGILAPRDAERAADHGVAAVWVSNHGGRQLDGAVTAAEVLAEVVDAVDGRLEVYADGGIRRASDVLVALALGARAVFIGRPFLYALAVAGEAGVEHAISILADELRRSVANLGATSLADLRREHLRPVPSRDG